MSDREPTPKRPITQTRIVIWVVAGGVGLYMLVSGLVGALSGGA